MTGPKLSRAALGALFGGMKPSSIFNSLQRSGVPTAKRVFNSIPKDTILALYDDGQPQWRIAEIVGCSQSAVSLIIRGKMGVKPPPRLMDDYTGQIKAMFDGGLKLVEIADRLEFTSGAVSKFVRKHRWCR